MGMEMPPVQEQPPYWYVGSKFICEPNVSLHETKKNSKEIDRLNLIFVLQKFRLHLAFEIARVQIKK